MSTSSTDTGNTLNTAQSWQAVLRVFAPALWSHRSTLAVSYACLLLAVAAAALLPWPLKFVIDHVLADNPLPAILPDALDALSAQALVIVLALASGIIAIAGAVFGAIEKNLGAQVREALGLELRDRMLAHIQTLPLHLDIGHRTGEFVLRVVDDTNQVVRLLTRLVPNVFQQLATTLILVGVMFHLQRWLGLLGLVVVAVLFMIAWRYGRALRNSARDKRLREGDVSALATEIMRGLPHIQALGLERGTRRRFREANTLSLSAGVRATRTAVALERSMNVVKGVAFASVLGGGGLLVLGGELTLGDLTVCTAYITQLLRPVAKMNEQAASAVRAFTRGEQLLAVLQRRPAVIDHPSAINIDQARGEIELRGVEFAYPATHAGKNTAVLRDVDLRFEPGSLTVLVGQSGAGKSTLLKLLLRLLEPDRGDILLDGVPYTKLTLESLRRQFAVAMQTTHLFAGTLRDALQPPAADVPDAALWQALDQVALGDFAEALPGGLDAVLGEDGLNLSGGQRARLSLARAFLMERPIVLLDEPLANVDTRSQTILVDALDALRGDKCCIAVSHQPVLVERADRVLRIDQGLIVESDRHRRGAQVVSAFPSRRGL